MLGEEEEPLISANLALMNKREEMPPKTTAERFSVLFSVFKRFHFAVDMPPKPAVAWISVRSALVSGLFSVTLIVKCAARSCSCKLFGNEVKRVEENQMLGDFVKNKPESREPGADDAVLEKGEGV